MKFLIVAIMAFSYMNGDKPIFVFTHENFDTVEQCVEHVQSNSQSLMYKLMAEFPNQKRKKTTKHGTIDKTTLAAQLQLKKNGHLDLLTLENFFLIILSFQ